MVLTVQVGGGRRQKLDAKCASFSLHPSPTLSLRLELLEA